MRRLFPSTLAAGLLLAAAGAHAQKPIGTVPITDASVDGVLQINGGTATIVNNGTVTAHEQTATVTLARGGTVNVCTTSTVHLSQSTGDKGGPLLFALDRGALELGFLSDADDAVLTPDMRLQPSTAAPLDLRIRVVANGDTCVENRGSDAPALIITDTFGESNYILHPRQHVLFEHGSLKEVVDNETSPCGCPPAQAVISVAEGGVSAAPGGPIAKPGDAVATTSADAHPFPEAESEGLAPAAPPQQSALAHVSTGLALTYNSPAPQPDTAGTAAVGEPSSAPAAAAAPAAASEAPVPAAAPATTPVVAQAPPPPPPPTNDLAHAFVRFYRWLFHRKPSPATPQS
ncbi:MAG TPA: hypothetical protein VNU94_03880 [Acidobacteriaceae bacterium]|nr:hypothetical protein [Acidobacteriaceae bacterium]